jgi:hypothetical protein
MNRFILTTLTILTIATSAYTQQKRAEQQFQATTAQDSRFTTMFSTQKIDELSLASQNALVEAVRSHDPAQVQRFCTSYRNVATRNGKTFAELQQREPRTHALITEACREVGQGGSGKAEPIVDLRDTEKKTLQAVQALGRHHNATTEPEGVTKHCFEIAREGRYADYHDYYVPRDKKTSDKRTLIRKLGCAVCGPTFNNHGNPDSKYQKKHPRAIKEACGTDTITTP